MKGDEIADIFQQLTNIRGEMNVMNSRLRTMIEQLGEIQQSVGVLVSD